MQLITFTQLRTKTKKLADALEAGQTVDLIRRSEIVGEIRPKTQKTKVFNAKKFGKIVEKMNLPQLSHEERDKRYREAMEKKHGKIVS